MVKKSPFQWAVKVWVPSAASQGRALPVLQDSTGGSSWPAFSEDMLFFDIVDQEVQNTLQARGRTGLRRCVWTDSGAILYTYFVGNGCGNLVFKAPVK